MSSSRSSSARHARPGVWGNRSAGAPVRATDPDIACEPLPMRRLCEHWAAAAGCAGWEAGASKPMRARGWRAHTCLSKRWHSCCQADGNPQPNDEPLVHRQPPRCVEAASAAGSQARGQRWRWLLRRAVRRIASNRRRLRPAWRCCFCSGDSCGIHRHTHGRIDHPCAAGRAFQRASDNAARLQAGSMNRCRTNVWSRA